MQTIMSLSRRSCLLGLPAAAISLLAAPRAKGLPSVDLSDLTQATKRLPASGGVLELQGQIGRNQDTSLVLENFKNLAIEAPKASFEIGGRQPLFRFRNCNGIRLSDIDLRWNSPGLTQGRLVDASQDQKQITIQIVDKFYVPATGEVASIFGFDQNSYAPIEGLHEIGGRQIVSSNGLPNGLIRLTLNVPFSAPPNAILVMKLRGPSAPAFIFENCQDITIERARIRSAPQMGISMRRCSNIAISNTEIGTTATSGPAVTIGADGVHFLSCRGNIAMDSCTLSGLGDDCVNIHEFYYAVSKMESDWITLAPETNFELQHISLDNFLPVVGDRVDIIDRNKMGYLDNRTITELDTADHSIRIKLSKSLPADASGGSLLICRTPSDLKVSIRRSSFSRTRARGLVIHSQAQISECSFENIGYSGILGLADAKMWGEGCSVENVRIDKNTFKRCGLYRPGVIEIGAQPAFLSPPASPDAGSSTDVLITSNRFFQYQSPAIKVASVRSVKIRENQFGGDGRSTNAALAIEQVASAEVRMNTFSEPSFALMDRDSLPGAKIEDNIGLSLRLLKH